MKKIIFDGKKETVKSLVGLNVELEKNGHKVKISNITEEQCWQIAIDTIINL